MANTDFKVRNDLIVNNNIFATNVAAGQIAINTTPNNVILTINSTDGIQLPVGNTSQRPASNNILRFNTDINQVEYSANSTWNNFSYNLNSGRLYLGGWQSNTATNSNSTIVFVPYNGGYTRINGTIWALPGAGVSANVANCNLNGVSGSSLVANTVYYTYLFSNSGTLALDFSTTGHTTSVQANNVGTEIKTGDNTRTLIGMIYPTAGPVVKFGSNSNSFFIANWFNRRDLSVFSSISGTAATGGAWANLPAGNMNILLWGDELGVMACITGQTLPDLQPAEFILNIAVGNTSNIWIGYGSYVATGSQIWASLLSMQVSDQGFVEGLNPIFPMIWTQAGYSLQYGINLSAIYSG